VAKWERVTDPTSSKPKPFGFCTFIGAESVLRALRLLNGLEIDGGGLLVKVDAKTQTLLNEYEVRPTAVPRSLACPRLPTDPDILYVLSLPPLTTTGRACRRGRA